MSQATWMLTTWRASESILPEDQNCEKMDVGGHPPSPQNMTGCDGLDHAVPGHRVVHAHFRYKVVNKAAHVVIDNISKQCVQHLLIAASSLQRQTRIDPLLI